MGTHHCNHCFKDSISFVRTTSLSPSESPILLKQSNCSVGNVKYTLILPVTMEVACFGWGKMHMIHKIHVIAQLFISLSVPLSYLVHTGVWGVAYPGERAEVGSDLCHRRQLWEIPPAGAVAHHGLLIPVQQSRNDLYPMKCPCGKSVACVPLPQRGIDWKEILVCSAGAAFAATPPNSASSRGNYCFAPDALSKNSHLQWGWINHDILQGQLGGMICD